MKTFVTLAFLAALGLLVRNHPLRLIIGIPKMQLRFYEIITRSLKFEAFTALRIHMVGFEL
jgi:hypothetical protein